MVKTFCARRNETEKSKLYLFSLPTKVPSESHVGKKLELLVSTEKENLLRHNFPPRTESNFFSLTICCEEKQKKKKSRSLKSGQRTSLLLALCGSADQLSVFVKD